MWLSPTQAVLTKQRARNAKQMNHKPFLQNIPYFLAIANAGSDSSCQSKVTAQEQKGTSLQD